MKTIKKYLLALIIVLVIDMLWLGVIMRSFYNNQLLAFTRPEQFPIVSALLAWILIPLGIVVFVDRLAKNNKEAFKLGGLYGFILYGVYEFTNYAILGGWTIPMVIVDIVWGTVLCGVTAVLVKVLSRRIITKK